MSIDTCSKCGARVDTDEDTEFYGEDGEGFNRWPSLCENCREEFDSVIDIRYLSNVERVAS